MGSSAESARGACTGGCGAGVGVLPVIRRAAEFGRDVVVVDDRRPMLSPDRFRRKPGSQ